MNNRDFLKWLAFCLLLFPMALVAQVPTYTGVEIRSDFTPVAINTKGQMVGTTSTSAGKIHAALLSNGVLTDLGVLPGGDTSRATAINVHGAIVGNSNTGGQVTHAFLYSNGVMQDLGTLPRGATSYATDINDAGQITGWSDTLLPNSTYPRPDHAFLYSAGVMTDLGNIASNPTGSGFGNFSAGTAINASGEVVGWSINNQFETHAFIYTGGTMRDLGTLGGTESRATDINDSSTVVGWSLTSGDAGRRAFKATGTGSMTNLGTLPANTASYGTALNNAGIIIGTSYFNSTPAFAYTTATGMVKLDSYVSGTGWVLTSTTAISTAGHIIARGTNGVAFGANFLLTPPADTINSAAPQALSGTAFNGQSDPVANSSSSYSIGLTRNNGGTYTTTASVSEDVRIIGIINPEAQHLGQFADIFVVDRVNLGFTMKNLSGIWLPWNGRVPELVPWREDVLLTYNLQVDIFTGKLGTAGDHRVFLGYMGPDGKLRYTPAPLRLTIAP